MPKIKRKKINGRFYQFFVCPDCGEDFKRRSDYVKKATGLCTKCATKRAGKKEQLMDIIILTAGSM